MIRFLGGFMAFVFLFHFDMTMMPIPIMAKAIMMIAACIMMDAQPTRMLPAMPVLRVVL